MRPITSTWSPNLFAFRTRLELRSHPFHQNCVWPPTTTRRLKLLLAALGHQSGAYANPTGWIAHWLFRQGLLIFGIYDNLHHILSPVVIGFNGDFLSHDDRLAHERLAHAARELMQF
jgi:hypothetical protein